MRALITGASSGIGRDLTKILVKKYDELILVARDKNRLEKLQKELLSNYENKIIKIVSIDLSDYKNCIKIYENHKDIDLLVNDAGFGDCGFFDKTDLEKDVNMINTNITALHTLTKLYLKDMIKKDHGHILNVASIAGFLPGPLMATYYASKSYVVKLSESIRQELKERKSNVRISILCPGPVKTNFEKNANVEFQVSKKSSEKVAEYAIKHLNRFYICPGFLIKLSRICVRFIPTNLLSKFIYKGQKRRIR